MELVRNFKGLTKSDANIAGGKGASLGEMTKAGIPVPPGFVVLAQTFERFVNETGLDIEIDSIFHTVNHKEIHTVEGASEKIKALILNVPMPEDIQKSILESFDALGAEYVAVRSSATAEDGAEHAWAGQLDSYLNTTRDNVVDKVKHCWASLFTPRAIFYRFEKYQEATHLTKISVAVVVQKMVNSEISGIAFSVHPVTEDRNQLIIEAGFGLGEAIVSGQITPDSYVVEKTPRRTIDVSVNSQTRGLYRVSGGGNEWHELGAKGDTQVLTETQISELSEIIVGIENHYKFPCDIEWAFEGGKFYIVQSRPITTLTHVFPESHSTSNPSKPEFKSPELASFNPDNYVFLGQWKNDLFATCFWQDCWVPDLISELGIEMTGIRNINLNGGYFFVEKKDFESLDKQIGEKIEKGDDRFFKHIVSVSNRTFEEGIKVGQKLRNAEPSLENFKKFVEIAKKVNFLWLIGATYMVEAAEKRLQDTVVKEKFPAEHVLEIVPKVITPLYHRHHELIDLKKEVGNKSLSEIKSDKKLNKKFQEHVEKYAWIEVFNFIGEPLTAERLYEQVEHMQDLAEVSPYVPEKSLSSELTFRANCMSSCGYIKQAGAEYFSIFSERVLPFLNATAKKIGLSYREFTLLSVPEIERALKGELNTEELKNKAIARKDKNNWMLLEIAAGKVVIIEDSEDVEYLKKTMIPRADKSAKEIKGQIGNPGKYTGPVRIVMNTDDFSKMKAGDVLVSTMTTPDFVVLMQKAGAIVTDIGGLLCHAAIVSREIKTPCVIGTKFATQILKDDQMVEVDADKGIIRII
jgi:phosphoenolpyruvate synthase/pyruvate phosphate dikinase